MYVTTTLEEVSETSIQGFAKNLPLDDWYEACLILSLIKTKHSHDLPCFTFLHLIS